MTAINQRAFSRAVRKSTIRFAESKAGAYQQAVLLNKSSGGMSFITHHKLDVGATIFLERPNVSEETGDVRAYRNDLAEVRWCIREKNEERGRWKVGVKLFSTLCALCGKEIHYHDPEDLIDLCEACRNRFAALSEGKIKAVIEAYLLGNVL